MILSSARSSLVARGRRDAAGLIPPCNKCGERKELVFAGCVCVSCSDALDEQWATCTATDWVLVTNFVSEDQKQREQKLADIMQTLKDSLAKAKGEQVNGGSTDRVHAAATKPRAHIYRNTTYIQMKIRWANQDPPDALTVDHYQLGRIADDEMVRIKSRPTLIPYIRSATAGEIADHRDRLRYQVISNGFEKWGLDDEGRPIDARWDRATTERALQSASEEIKARFEELGLEYSDAERRELERQ